MPSPALSGFFFCFAAMVLLIFVSVSTPVWRNIYFLKATVTEEIRYGIWGYCVQGGECSSAMLGYAPSIEQVGGNYTEGSSVLQNFTKVMILHPIAGALALFAVLWGLAGVALASRTCTILMSLTAFLALLASLVAFAIDLALWIIIRNRIRDRGFEAELGNANWLTVGAVAALILGTCTAACGSCGRFATGRMGGEKY
ncbi:hypothetical protein FFLO_02228 [Filobasidium floriforme]|uniref:Pali-domain-containing protein n=1 Tax=Filobasidium floriforme TaxID=5210 RepID=A0A8K0NRI4_9TREE|nr:actin cortical patch SUR7/pH-response regulator pali [Filobasidium floriforme]KAG7562336.1 hypothetical protein FFLO_02228 [Filobasidium floriforme]KAH8077934.1 actin cortical patch SUR7/pH-response regulator pali [Filobasidium floriforme]